MFYPMLGLMKSMRTAMTMMASRVLLSNRVELSNPRRNEEMIENGGLVESKMGDLFASATSDTSKRKLVTKAPIFSLCSCSLISLPFHIHHSLRPVAKKSKPALPLGLLPDASVSCVNLTTQLANSTKAPTTRTSHRHD